jgi:hypothetical protein
LTQNFSVYASFRRKATQNLTPINGDDIKVGNIACKFTTLKYFAASLTAERLLSHTEIIYIMLNIIKLVYEGAEAT